METECIFLEDDIHSSFIKSDLGSFEAIWALDIPWFEEPNCIQNGWSGVVKYHTRDGEEIFIKRQQNYFYKTLRHPIKGILSLEKEYKSIQLLTRLDIPTLLPYFFGKRIVDNNEQAILVTKSLSDMLSLESYLQKNKMSEQQISLLSSLIRKLHKNNICHGALYGKHIYINPVTNAFTLIDLENTKKVLFKWQSRKRDFRRLFKRTKGWNAEMSETFISHYQLNSKS